MSTPPEEGLGALALSDACQEEGPSAPDHNPSGEAGNSRLGHPSDLGDTTCAICLNKICAFEAAQPEGCEHLYCVCCILHWAVYKEAARCPQCKAPFSSLMTYRKLDGQLRDYPSRESVCLLKRTCWLQDHVKMREQAMAEAATLRPPSARLLRGEEGSVIDDSDYIDYERYYEEYDDDEEVENYYFSAAAGRARIVIGNRRNGPNGFISSGRMQARPAPPAAQPKGKKTKAPDESTPGRTTGRRQASGKAEDVRTPAQKLSGRLGSSRSSNSAQSEADSWPGSSSGGKESAGRRARRNQRRAAADARAGL